MFKRFQNMKSKRCLKNETLLEKAVVLGVQMRKINESVVGQNFGRLLILEVMKTPKRNGKGAETRVICLCDCGQTTKPLRLTHVKNGHVKSCGCLRNEKSIARIQILNSAVVAATDAEVEYAIRCETKFGKLTILSICEERTARGEKILLCSCECGKTIRLPRTRLFHDNVKSCGCLRDDQEYVVGNRTYEPQIASARSRFNSSTYKDGNLAFDQFLALSQLRCHYCDAQPSNNYNVFKKYTAKNTYALDNGNFVYNGLDRLDSSRPHDIDNVVPCCWECNMAKNNRTVEQFARWILRVQSWAQYLLGVSAKGESK